MFIIHCICLSDHLKYHNCCSITILSFYPELITNLKLFSSTNPYPSPVQQTSQLLLLRERDRECTKSMQFLPIVFWKDPLLKHEIRYMVYINVTNYHFYIFDQQQHLVISGLQVLQFSKLMSSLSHSILHFFIF